MADGPPGVLGAERDLDLTTIIVKATAGAAAVAVTDLTSSVPHDVIDGPGIEAVLFHEVTDPPTNHSSVESIYGDFRVVVQSDGWILVYEPDDAP